MQPEAGEVSLSILVFTIIISSLQFLKEKMTSLLLSPKNSRLLMNKMNTYEGGQQRDAKISQKVGEDIFLFIKHDTQMKNVNSIH